MDSVAEFSRLGEISGRLGMTIFEDVEGRLLGT